MRRQLGAAVEEPSMSRIATAHEPRQPDRRDRDTGPRAVDTSSAKQAAQRLAALGEMTGGIAHDLRNILAVIESGLTLAERHSAEPEKARAYLAGARDGIDRGLKLTAQLLNFAKLPELDAQPTDANVLLRKLEQFLRYGAGPGVRIELELTSDLPKCLLDQAQFNAAILNLVINARDAMPNGGEIHISTDRCTVERAASNSLAPGIYVRVRIVDNGPGMSADVAGRIFDRFFTTKGERGTGLGLPQVSAFMRLVGGHVSMISEPGVGTVFDLLFPSATPGGMAVGADRPTV